MKMKMKMKMKIEGNCSGAPPRGSSTGGLFNQNALYRHSFPPHEVSIVDF
jgi:hypothetical protein